MILFLGLQGSLQHFHFGSVLFAVIGRIMRGSVRTGKTRRTQGTSSAVSSVHIFCCEASDLEDDEMEGRKGEREVNRQVGRQACVDDKATNQRPGRLAD